MRVIFMGTPVAAVPALRAVAETFDVVAVYTRADKPQGRGLQVAPSAVKLAATELGLRVVQPRTLRNGASELELLAPDAIAVAAYGMLLPPDVLSVPRLGCVNVHFSLLPRWRGAAPVERAILAGDATTGVTTMLMDEGLDTGPILLQEPIDIVPDDTSRTLRARLAEIGGELLVRTLSEFDTGTIVPQPQDESSATLAPKLSPDDAELDPSRPAASLERTVRALDPSPGAFLSLRGRRLKVWRAALVDGEGEPGTVADPEAVDVQTSQGRLRLLEVQPEGKRRMDATSFARGARLEVGERIGPDTATG